MATSEKLSSALLRHNLKSVVDKYFPLAHCEPEQALCEQDFDSGIKTYLTKKNSEDGNSLMLLTINFV